METQISDGDFPKTKGTIRSYLHPNLQKENIGKELNNWVKKIKKKYNFNYFLFEI